MTDSQLFELGEAWAAVSVSWVAFRECEAAVDGNGLSELSMIVDEQFADRLRTMSLSYALMSGLHMQSWPFFRCDAWLMVTDIVPVMIASFL